MRVRPTPLARLATLSLCCGALLPRAAAAADVVVTDFTPASFDEFAVAEDLGNLLVMALEDAGLRVLSDEELTARVGTAADTCADEPACPGNLWNRVDAPVILVGRVKEVGDHLRVSVEVWERGRDGPSFLYEEELSPAAAGAFLMRIADNLAPDRGEAPTVTTVGPGVTEESYAPIGDGADRNPPTVEEVSLEGERAPLSSYRLPLYVQRDFERSGLELDAWLDAARIRTPAVFLEVHGGAVMGDLDRRYDVRVALYDEAGDSYTERDVYTYDTFLNGRGATGGVAVGYQLAWWLDIGVLGSVQFGRKELTTGSEVWLAGAGEGGSDLYVDGAGDDPKVWDPVSAVLAVAEPRVRLYPLAMGAFKPYALVGFNLRFYDGYDVPDGELTSYPAATGGLGFGPTLGGGLAIDATERVTGLLEVPWTYVVSPNGPQISGGTRLETVPQQFVGVGQFLCLTAGIGVSFR